MFCKKNCSRNSAKFTGKHLCQRLFFKKESLAQVFSCEFCEFLRTPFLQNTSGRMLLTSFMTPKAKESSFYDLIRLVSCYFASFMALKAKNEKFLWLDKTCFFLFCFVYDFKNQNGKFLCLDKTYISCSLALFMT